MYQALRQLMKIFIFYTYQRSFHLINNLKIDLCILRSKFLFESYRFVPIKDTRRSKYVCAALKLILDLNGYFKTIFSRSGIENKKLKVLRILSILSLKYI